MVEKITGSEALTVGGGCFWCVESVFNQVKGVHEAVSGYAGGARANPTYEQVCGGATGHAEVVQIRFDPARIGVKDLLRIFFTVHDPTTLNRQGADVGTQYRSVVFYADEAQRAAAEAVRKEIEEAGIYDAPIVTEIRPLDAFYPAEKYHQRYFENNPGQPYCQFVIAPKVAKFRKQFEDRLKV